LEEGVVKAPAHSGILLSAKTTFHCSGRFRVYDIEAIGLSSEMRGVNVKDFSLRAQVLPAAPMVCNRLEIELLSNIRDAEGLETF
jgi:hypothetical protein